MLEAVEEGRGIVDWSENRDCSNNLPELIGGSNNKVKDDT